ncbi:MAG TPA: gamma carbonic anhydrase family protein [Syntrophomonadaceae bacterium]|nr:gamma carbonic anhydrase family protein [Syntrophomonadaceae bacterium]
MALYEFEGKHPLIPENSFVHPQASVIGEVELGEGCFIGPGAVIRGDYGRIVVGRGSNVQDNSVIHADPDSIAIIEDNVIIGHGAILHGPCLVKQGAMVGMGAIVSNGCELGLGSVLAAGSLLTPGQIIPDHKVALGNPALIIKDLSDNTSTYLDMGARLYQELSVRCVKGLKLIPE